MAEGTIDLATDMKKADVPQFTFKKRSAKAKSNFRKKAATPPPASDSDSDFVSSGDEEGHRIKRRRKNATVTASNMGHSKPTETPVSATAAPLVTTNDATKQSNWYDEGNDEALSAKNLLGNPRARPGQGDPSSSSTSVPDGTYKGAANYQSFIQTNPNAPTRKVGPMKAATNVRTITVTDYAPDVCKVCSRSFNPGFKDLITNVQLGLQTDGLLRLR
jgi:RING finger protein 113A